MGKRNCDICGKPMEKAYPMQKWHTACKRSMPGYLNGYKDGERTSKKRSELNQISALTDSQRQQIAREVFEEAKAKLEREMAEKKARLDLIQREKAAADCHNRMLKAGFELPPFRFHPDVETIHAEQQERV